MPGFWYSNRKDLMSRFSWMLYKPPDEHLAIIFSEGYTLLSGVWQQEQRGVRVRYHTLYANVWGLDRSNPDREEVLDYAPAKEPGRLASWLRSSELLTKPADGPPMSFRQCRCRLKSLPL